jgi:hypothetical protein
MLFNNHNLAKFSKAIAPLLPNLKTTIVGILDQMGKDGNDYYTWEQITEKNIAISWFTKFAKQHIKAVSALDIVLYCTSSGSIDFIDCWLNQDLWYGLSLILAEPTEYSILIHLYDVDPRFEWIMTIKERCFGYGSLALLREISENLSDYSDLTNLNFKLVDSLETAKKLLLEDYLSSTQTERVKRITTFITTELDEENRDWLISWLGLDDRIIPLLHKGYNLYLIPFD